MDFAFLSLEEQPPNTLYQYTSLEALVSIVQSKRVWASNIRFLNDHSESLWLRQHVVSILKRKGSSTGQKERMNEIIAMIEAWPPFSLFVASFTEKPDNLSQWRAYCHPGLGVSIGFSAKCLSEQWIANPHDLLNPFFLSAMLRRARYYSTADEREPRRCNGSPPPGGRRRADRSEASTGHDTGVVSFNGGDVGKTHGSGRTG
jgi:hypothetical protein